MNIKKNKHKSIKKIYEKGINKTKKKNNQISLINRNIDLNLKDNNFFFIQMADTQIGFMKAINDITNKKDNYSYNLEKKLLNNAIKYINILKPAFGIVCGDMTNEWPEKELIKDYNTKTFKFSKEEDKLIKNGNEKLRYKQIKDYKKIISKSKIPLLCLCGNHDVGNIPSNSSLKEYKNNFGLDYYSFVSGKCKCIIINSQLWKNDKLVKKYRKEHDKWIDNEISDASKDESIEHIILFGHIPLFIKKYDEDESSYNLPINLRSKEKLNRWINMGVSHYFCGHFHQDTTTKYICKDSPNKNKTLEIIVTGSSATNLKNDKRKGKKTMYEGGMGIPVLGEKDSGVRVVKVSKKINHSWYTYNDIEDIINKSKKKGIKPDEIFKI
jgi:serine/threonine-protein phosphatase CPPED1